MTILTGDIKLLASEVMSDTDEGGGAPTSTVIVDGLSNSIFNDISELNRSGGHVSMRKVFASIQSDNTDTYLGANIIVASIPSDPLVSVTIFEASGTFDERTDARDRVESYLAKGARFAGYLLEDHIAGQRAIRIFQRPGADTPSVGETLYLVYNSAAQYVRITSVATEQQTFTVVVGTSYVDYTGQVVTCGLADKLLYDFSGSAASRLYTGSSTATIVYETFVADAGSYYSASPTTSAIEIGDVTADVESIYTKIVPSAQTETALVDMTAGGTAQALIAAGTSFVTYSSAVAFGAATSLNLGAPVLPGTLTIAYAGGTMSDSSGQVVAGSTVIGSIDYSAGTISFLSSAPTYSGTKTITFTPAAAPLRIADTLGVEVTIEGRAYNYVQTILPAPAPGTLQVSYYVQGAWYTLYDSGTGRLAGSDTDYGAGTINYTTGTVSVTLGALPDIGSEILFAWGGTASYFNRASIAPDAPQVNIQLADTGITPGSFSATWNDGTARSVTDDGAGNITGSATGTIDYATGLVELTPSVLPLGGQVYSVSYTYGEPSTATITGPTRNGDGTVTLNLGTGLKPGSISLTLELEVTDYSFLSNTPAEMQYYKESAAYVVASA